MPDNTGLQRKIKYQFSTKLWKHNSEGGWYFVTVPNNYSVEIRNNLQWQEEGWGRMKARAVIKEMSWDTSIWFDTKIGAYVLPVKAEIRKKLSLAEGDLLEVTIFI